MKLQLKFSDAAILSMSGLTVYAFDKSHFYSIAPGETDVLQDRSIDLVTKARSVFGGSATFYNDLDLAFSRNKDALDTIYNTAKRNIVNYEALAAMFPEKFV